MSDSETQAQEATQKASKSNFAEVAGGYLVYRKNRALETMYQENEGQRMERKAFDDFLAAMVDEMSGAAPQA